MSGLTPLIELASQRSLDLFFRVGQGYVTRTFRTGGRHEAGGWGLDPVGVQARAEARIVCTMPPPPPEARLNAWPVGPQAARPSGLRR